MKIARRLMALLLALTLLTGNVITPVLATEPAAEPEVTVEEVPEAVTEAPVDEVPDEEPADEEPVVEAPVEEPVVEETAAEPVVNAEAPAQLTAEDTDATEEPVAGATLDNPLYPEWTWNEEQTEATAQVTVPAGTTYYIAVTYPDMIMTVNDGVPFAISGSRMAPAIHTIMNDGAEDVVYTLTLSVPVGTQANPEAMEYGFWGGYAAVAENSQGYYYSYIAEGTGYITASIGDITPAGVEADIVLNNLNTYANRTLQADTVDGFVTMAVTEGDPISIQIVTLPDDNWNYPAAEIYWSGSFSEYAPGTQENPIFPIFQWNDSNSEATASVTVPVGTSYYAVKNGNGMLLSINGAEPIELTATGWAPAYFTITNDGEAAAVYTLKLSYPLGNMYNPEALADGETTVAVKADTWGYYLNYTAADRGTVTMSIAAADADGNATGWSYTVNNMSTYIYGDQQWSDSDPVVNPAVISVNKGDQLQIIVNTYDEATYMVPAGNVTLNVSFEAALGAESNPEMISFTMNADYSQGTATVTVPANTTYYVQSYGVSGMQLAINGEDAGLLEGNPRMPVTIAVTNDTDAEAVYTLTVSYPLGSQNNPEVLEYLGGFFTQEEGDADGYNYTYTADSTGYLYAYITYVDSGVAGNIVLTNQITYEQQNMLYDGVNGMVIMSVTEGDVISINVCGMPADGSWGYPYSEIGWTGAISADLPGSEANPLAIDSLLVWNENNTEATATVTVPAASTGYFTVSVAGMFLSINGEGSIALEGSRWMPASFTIENEGEAAADYVLKIVYAEGSMDNPMEITDGEVSVELAEGSQGYYYTYTATERGELSVGVAAVDADGNELGWTYAVNNMTSYVYGDTQWSDSDPVVNPYTVSVNKGDVIEIMVNTYDPNNMWSAPAGTVTVTTSFAPGEGTQANPMYPNWEWNDDNTEGTVTVTVPAGESYYVAVVYSGVEMTINGGEAVVVNGSFWMPEIVTLTNDGNEAADYTITVAYPEGSYFNPMAAELGDTTVELAEGTEGYYYSWIAEENGVLVFTMNGETGWTYAINNLTKGVYGDTQWSDSGSAVSAMYVQAGDEIQIMVNTYDPNNMWSAPAGTVSFNLTLNPTSHEIASGKTLTLKFVHPEAKTVSASKVNWEIAGTYVYDPNGNPVKFDDASAYATLSAGKLKTKTCGDRVMMVVKATLKADEAVSVNYYVEIIPASTKLSIWNEFNEPVVGSWTWNMNGETLESDPSWALYAYSYPSNSKQEVVWTSSNKKVVTVEDGVLYPVATYNKAGEFTGYKTGTTTITAKTLDGTKKASFKLTLTKYASYVEIVDTDDYELTDIPWAWHWEWNEETQQEEMVVTEWHRGIYVDAGTKNLQLVAESDPNASTKGVIWECYGDAAKITSSGKLTVDAKAKDGYMFSVYAYSKDRMVRDEIIVTVVNDAVSVNIYPDYDNPNFVWTSENAATLDVSTATKENIPSLTIRGWVSNSNGDYVEDISDWKVSGSKNITAEVKPYWETGEWVDGQWVNEIHYDMENQPEGYPTYYSVVVTPKWNEKKAACYTGTITLTGTTSDGKTKASYKVTAASLVSSLEIVTKDGENMGTEMVWDNFANWNPEYGYYEGGWYEGPVVYATAGQTINLKAVTNDNATNKSVYWWAYSETFPEAVKFSNGKLTIGKDVPVEAVIWVEAQAKDQSYLYTKIPVIVTPRVTNVHISADFEGWGNQYYVSNTTKTWDYNDGNFIDLSNLNYPFESSQEVKWTVSNSKIGYIEETTNDWGMSVTRLYLTGEKFGKLTVTATAQDGSNVKSTFTLNVIRSVQNLYLYDNAVAAGKSLKLAKSLYVDPNNATNKKVEWTMTMEDGSEVPKTLATLNKNTGVLSTKKAAVGTTVKVTATAKDGYGATVTVNVRICEPTTSVDIMDVHGINSGVPFEVINKKTVSTAKDAFFFVADCKPSGKSAGMFSWKLSNEKDYAVVFAVDEEGNQYPAVVQIPDADGNVKYGNVKLTIKAEDGTNKSTYIYIDFVEPELPQ